MHDAATRVHAPLLFAVLPALLLSACGGSSSAGPSDGGFSDDRPATRAAFEQARGRWASLGISDYDYAFRRSCFCTPDYTAPVHIAVRGGRVVEVTSDQTGEPRSGEGYPTVEDLFAMLQEALDSGAQNVEATYDPGRGHPTRFYIDQDFRIADEEIRVETRDLEPRR